MEFEKEFEKPAVPTATQGSAADIAPSDPGDVMLARPADGGVFEPSAGAFSLSDLLAEGIDEALASHAEAAAQAGGTTTAEPVTAQPPIPTQPQPAAKKGTVIKMDALQATAAASFYIDVLLPSAFSMLGGMIVGDGYRYREMDKRFKQTYADTVRTLIQSGEITMPTPMQCFVVMTLFITFNNAMEMWKVKKAEDKTAKRAAAKTSRQIDESAPVPVGEMSAQKKPKPSDVSVEIARRTRFSVEDGFYVYDLAGVYISKKDRVFGPSKKVQEIIDIHGTDAKTVKKMLENEARPNQAGNS